MAVVDLSQSKTRWPVVTLLKRGLWTFLVEPLVRWLPKFCSPIRIQALRWMGASIGPNCMISRGVKVLMPWNLIFEDYVAIGRDVDLYNFAPITVRRMTVISQNCYLCTGSHDFRQAHMPLIYHPITIGSECWLAADVFVCPGVSVADGVVVGARSLVTKDLPETWSVYGGHPATRLVERKMTNQA